MRHRGSRRRSISMLLWGTLVIVLVLAYANRNPIRLATDDEAIAGSRPSSVERSDVMVVVWPHQIEHSAESGQFDEVDWSWVWVDALESELGPVRLCDAESLTQSRMLDVRFLVVTHSAALHPHLGDSVHVLEHFVNHDGVLLLERPEGPLREAFSADGRGGMRTPNGITQASGVSEDVAGALAEMPLFTRFVGSTGPLDGAETLLAMDGAPVVYRVERGGGAVVTVDFNFGLQTLSLQQGRPNGDGFSVEAAQPNAGPTTADLVADPRLLQAEVPYADLLEHFVIQVALGRDVPMVGLWPYPGGADGLILLTHDVERLGQTSAWIAEREASQQGSSTFFLGYQAIPPETVATQYAAAGARIGVLWERDDGTRTGSRRSIGLGGVRPFYRRASLRQHRDHFERSLPTTVLGRTAGLRMLDGAWDTDFVQSFGIVAASGFSYDTSYGMSAGPEDPAAYRYGTGRPFMVYDRTGLPFGVFEVPMIVPDLRSEAHIDALEQLLRRSQRSHHQTIGVQVDAELFLHADALGVFDAWESLLRLAQRRAHPVVSPDAFIAFRHERAQVGLSSHVEHDTDRNGAQRPGFRQVVEIDAQAEGLWLRAHAHVGEMQFREAGLADAADTEGDDSLQTRTVHVYGQEQVLIEVPRGSHVIEMVYR